MDGERKEVGWLKEKGEGVPRFGTREEEARFWDDTDLSSLPEGMVFEDIDDDNEGTAVRKPLTTTLAIRFDQRTVQLLRTIAKEQGLGATQVVRAWVLERLREQRDEVGPVASDEDSLEHLIQTKILESISREGGKSPIVQLFAEQLKNDQAVQDQLQDN